MQKALPVLITKKLRLLKIGLGGKPWEGTPGRLSNDGNATHA